MRLRGADIVVSLIAGVLLGAIIHIAIVLRIPAVARDDAFSRYALLGANGEAQIIPHDAARMPGMGDDPAVVRGVCAWNLQDGPVSLIMPVSGLVQTMSIHDRNGRVIYSLTDRAAVRGAVSLTIMTAAQQEERRLTQPDDKDDDETIEVVSSTTRGLAVIRAVAASPAWRDRAGKAVSDVTCTPED